MKRCLLAVLCLFPASALAAPPADYAKQVRPILKARCYSCHGALKQEGELRLDTAARMRQGGESGPAVTPKNPGKSQLFRRITSKDKDERMPPEGKPLSAAQIQIIRSWIVAGAKVGKRDTAEEDPRKHWAFQRPKRPPLPKVKNTKWVLNPIDNFVAAQRDRRGIVPLPRASKVVLLRRVYLDLIGLPPTRKQLHNFLNDRSSNAYLKVVDGLLKSPRYGERWGRHWMDVWRYSDWYGRRKVPDVLNSYAQIWRWRDWIIRSVNQDKGYDRMVMEMLAADEIDPGNDKTAVATGFVLRNFYRWNYNTWMKDSVEHTGKAFLALTLNCCHCHNHKYDPISNKEYFRFRAFFEPLEVRHDRAAGEPDPGPYPKYKYGASYKPITSGMVRVMDEKLDAKTFMYTKGEARNIIPGLPPVSPGAPSVIGGDTIQVKRVKLPPESWYPGIKAFVQKEEIDKRRPALKTTAALLVKAKKYLQDSEAKLKALQGGKGSSGKNAAAHLKARKSVLMARMTMRVDTTHVSLAAAEMAAIQARVHADNVRYKGHKGDPKQAAQAAHRAEKKAKLETFRLALARAERKAMGKAKVSLTTPLDVPGRVFDLLPKTASLNKLRKAVASALSALKAVSETYTALSTKYPKYSTGRRAALARWVADRKNPLTARVAVNHIWARHFGRAIVKSTENFGRNGDRPTHPKLLDWLAVELMQGGWKMKRLHRLIVTSATYQQASFVAPQDRATAKQYVKMKTLDRDNGFLWRYNARRIEAEAVRDSILQVSRRLDLTMFGKEISQSLGLTNRRRSVYFDHHGEGRMQILDLFDAADPCDCYRRSTSVRPQQALALSNSRLAIQQGRLLARSLNKELTPSASPSQFAQAAFEEILSRSPTKNELLASEQFMQQQEKLFRSLKKVKTKKSKAKKAKKKKSTSLVDPSSDPVLRAREGFIQALFSHSDFVTIR